MIYLIDNQNQWRPVWFCFTPTAITLLCENGSAFA